MFITPAYYRFFEELERHMNRDWFKAHKDVFERDVFYPFKELTERVIEKSREIDPGIQLDFKQAAFRIYRDTRFSNDKSPYKLWMGAAVSRMGRKNTMYPEIYFQFGLHQNFIAGGLYRPDKQVLFKIRQAIHEHPEIMDEIHHDQQLRKFFPEGLQGERNKRLPYKEWMETAKRQPFILNKNFYTFKTLDRNEVMRPDLDNFIVDHFGAMEKWNRFLMDVLQNQ